VEHEIRDEFLESAPERPLRQTSAILAANKSLTDKGKLGYKGLFALVLSRLYCEALEEVGI
jgi:hypothetical protein